MPPLSFSQKRRNAPAAIATSIIRASVPLAFTATGAVARVRLLCRTNSSTNVAASACGTSIFINATTTNWASPSSATRVVVSLLRQAMHAS